MHNRHTKSHCLIATLAILITTALLVRAADPPKIENGGGRKSKIENIKTLAVLPFFGGDEKEKQLAEKMRFAVSQKLSNDADGGGRFDRMDNVKVEQIISGLQIPWAAGGAAGPGTLPESDEIEKLLTTLGVDNTVAGIVKGRKLTLILYEGTKEAKRADVQIPSDKESPKLAVERVLTELTGAKFAAMRQVEADHSDPAVEARFAARANLIIDGKFENGVKEGKAASWDAILGADHYSPPVLSAQDAASLPKDRVAVVPKSFAGDQAHADGHCLMLRLSKNVAANNGLACISTWIPVESGKKYRFTCNYFSKGPTTHLFINGYGVMPDQYGDKTDLEAVRRQLYRAQVLPTNKNERFERMEMDFTPSSLKPADPKIEWIRVNLYTYNHEGDIFFDDIVVKKLDE
ncbi:MAG: hypothetical protein FWD61_11850 [Phycisphaerales bacterium]|nr:hypothetical protein [Phycisphaerales bacterium]